MTARLSSLFSGILSQAEPGRANERRAYAKNQALARVNKRPRGSHLDGCIRGGFAQINFKHELPICRVAGESLKRGSVLSTRPLLLSYSLAPFAAFEPTANAWTLFSPKGT